MKIFPEQPQKWVTSSKLNGRIGRLIYRKYPGIFREVLYVAYQDLGKEWFLDFIVDQFSQELNFRKIAVNIEEERQECLKMREDQK